MCIRPTKVTPLKGERVFKFAFNAQKEDGNFKIIGRYNPGTDSKNPDIGCLTVVAVNDEQGKIHAGISAFRNRNPREPFQTSAGTNISRTRLLRNIKKKKQFNVPKLFLNDELMPVITELPKYVITNMQNRFEKQQAN